METGKKVVEFNEKTVDSALRRTPELSRHFDPDIRKELETRLFRNIESHSWHNSYDQEMRELSAITAGDVQLLEKSWNEFKMGEVGQMADDPLQNQKTNAIVVITTASRAAIQGGLSPEISFTLSDIYMSRVEKVTVPSDAMKLARDAEYLYTCLVLEQKQSRISIDSSGNERIYSCKDYVFRHLHEKISVYDIAEALDLNPDYLSTLFKKTEGISLTTYILNNKITLARNLLIYSN
ncbi:MAG: hypothetical protein IJV21_01715, partial [Lachnospiraceae bacterium]|nr:hypothetical protein [Lachnospiraceae bacterium]